MINSDLVTFAAQYVRGLYASQFDPRLLYHNLAHTERMTGHAKEIAAYYALGKEEDATLIVACWFHDVGHLTGLPEGHEARSVTEFNNFCAQQHVDDFFAARVRDCIMATRRAHDPGSLPEAIICDADTFNLGTGEFEQTDAALKEEMQLRTGRIADWDDKALRLLQSHRYFTEYCQRMLAAGLQKNIELVQARMRISR
ncbi:hypothetical protein EPD60_11195 [Flaviaesturariibacter flavus]|uniref:HD/PDEase domain-containing protein n=1 Tax=Flaviaesturariibacter flavus TaxID=2502780 RepID=A0A4V2NVR8_9BACT|nr:HD domain-containing protein [Flaviaesturariibacter flavus]TCJ14542.1 hypothetical protein EPD60_11195 [Flaviaesturariibacter flavus]